MQTLMALRIATAEAWGEGGIPDRGMATVTESGVKPDLHNLTRYRRRGRLTSGGGWSIL
jgi:hypothetical protein